MNDDEIMTYAKIGAPYEVLKQIKRTDVYQ